jgi:4-hydroxythreonine-4-phosphate dehydrogenase
VNFTAGLPIVRTSPDHGTGFDIAGKDDACADSMRAAIYTAIDVRANRVDHKEITSNTLTITPPRRDFRDSRR